MSLTTHYDEIARCNRCGFCQVACPIFRSTGHESGVARGRIALLRALIEGRVDWSKELEEPLFACLLCGACTSNCFPAVATSDLLVTARQEYLIRVERSRLHKLLFDHLLPYPKRLRLAAKAAALGKRSGLAHVAGALGLLRIFGRDFARSEEIVESFPPSAFRETHNPGVLKGKGEGLRIGYFVGCGMDIMTPEAAEDTVHLLLDMGGTVRILDNVCCGLPAKAYGDLEAARRLAEKNLERIGAHEFDLLVTDCSSCASSLKAYPKLFPETDPRHSTSKDMASRVRDVLELASCLEPPTKAKEGKIVATYHDPCHASRSQGLTLEPRRILESLPGIEFRELPEADWCCGGAGSYAFSHYDLAMKVLDRKMDNVEKTGAEVVVTSCPACMVQLAYGARKRNLPVRVRHISSCIADALSR
ncbi:MAG: (Fe-S)-binding protein [Deltaproteobacteria bacterium]|nr:(Fe-S)-binding protein [Deltaproteobacteria bacterium]